MVSKERWLEAQRYERSFWERSARRIEEGAGELTWYQWKADRCAGVLGKAFPGGQAPLGNMRALEVGSGPVGIVAYLPARSRVAIDPLGDFYASQPAFVRFRSPEVEYVAGQAETLGYDTASFDLVIIDNVIDHVHNADAVMAEIHRVLKPEGRLYFTVNLHPPFGAFKHEILARLKIDRGHPHTFTLSRVRRFLDRHGFVIRHEEWEDYRQCRAKDLRADSTKSRLKGLLGLSEFLYTSACQWKPK